MPARIALWGGFWLALFAAPAVAQQSPATQEHVVVYGTLPDSEVGLAHLGALVTPALSDPRSLTLRQPVSFQLGLKLKY